ncbi:sodium/myo-inositol cotransporter-like isoform X1 [Branchiostoma lanceolatum]|uniref:sodium/myo-inositol cotransporter-like isoform X1 n=3 Tax=Branchiostoma lanceolatum TaxID=7740 RepID=UPI0034554AB3
MRSIFPMLSLHQTYRTRQQGCDCEADKMAVETLDDLDTRLGAGDIVAVIVYFVAVVCVGLWAMRRSNRGTVSGFFLAGRTMIWLPVGASLFVSNIGSEHFIGLAGSGAAGGIGVGAWEFNALMLLQLLGWIFVPVYIACGTTTMPQWLRKRFGGQRLRVMFAVLSLVLYVMIKLSVNLYSGALFIEQSLGWNMYLSIAILLILTAIVTITGGLAAVIYTDTLQAVLMVLGAVALMIVSMIRVGGWGGLREQFMQAMPNITKDYIHAQQFNLSMDNYTEQYGKCGIPSDDSFVMLREVNDPQMPWLGFLLGQTPASIWYWCTDQVIVQRALAAKNLDHARGATLMAGFIKILPMFMMVVPGMVSRILFPNQVACADPATCLEVCRNAHGCTNIAYPKLVLGVMPVGARGIMMAVMVAALMSDLDSIYNSASTIFTIDIWQRMRPRAGNRELMIVGRVIMLILTVVSILWVPILMASSGAQLFIYIQEICDYLVPAIAAIFLLGVFWKRCNEMGAFWGLMGGVVIGLVRTILVFLYEGVRCGDHAEVEPPGFVSLHYMYYALIIFVSTIILTVVISLLTQPLPEYFTVRTTYWTYMNGSIRDDDVKMWNKLEQLQEEEGAKDDKIQDDEVVMVENEQPWYKRLFVWYCGFNEKTKEPVKKPDDFKARLRTLEQEPLIRVLLNILLVCILSIGIFCYVYFSVRP